MKNNEKLRYRCLLYCMAVLTILAFTLRCYAFRAAYDVDPGYFVFGAIPTLLYIVTFLAVLVCVGYALFCLFCKLPTTLLPDDDHRSTVEQCISFLVVIALIPAIYAELSLFLNHTPLGKPQNIFLILRLIFAILALPYFIIKRPRGATLLCGISFIFYLLMIIISDYFDWYVTMNSPIKTGVLLTCLSAAAFLLCELRLFNGTRLPLPYTVMGCLAAFFGVVNGVSLLVASMIGGIVTESVVSRSFAFLAVGIYAFVRLTNVKEAGNTLSETVSEPDDSSNAPFEEDIDHGN